MRSSWTSLKCIPGREGWRYQGIKCATAWIGHLLLYIQVSHLAGWQCDFYTFLQYSCFSENTTLRQRQYAYLHSGYLRNIERLGFRAPTVHGAHTTRLSLSGIWRLRQREIMSLLLENSHQRGAGCADLQEGRPGPAPKL